MLGILEILNNNGYMAAITILLPQIQENAKWFIEEASNCGATVSAVTKFCTSRPKIVDALYKNGIRSISDSNMENFFQPLPVDLKKNLIKTRMSDIRSIPLLPKEYCPDRIFISDRELLLAVRNLQKVRRPEIVLIAELGDFKEGMDPNEIRRSVREFSDLPIIGVSGNFSCLSGILPDMESIETLHLLGVEIRSVKNLRRPFVSVGGTVVWKLMLSQALRALVSEIRVGEGIFFGHDSSGGCAIPELYNTAFTLEGEIIEIATKDIELPGITGHTALGAEAKRRPTGERTCAVLDFGILAAKQADISVVDKALVIVGQTYDFTVVDITDSMQTYKVGGCISFWIQYAGASQAYINPYIDKET